MCNRRDSTNYLGRGMAWTCAACTYENEDGVSQCEACDEPKPAAASGAGAEDDPLANIVVGVVLEEPTAIKDRLNEVKLDIGDGKTISVVTNATNVKEGNHVVVALPGATVRGEAVTKAVVGGRTSHGMLCDAPALGWVGGGAGAAVVLGDEFPAGSRPPAARPRKIG